MITGFIMGLGVMAFAVLAIGFYVLLSFIGFWR